MIRIVADPSGRVLPDFKGNLPSRGAYVCPDGQCLMKASRGRLGGALKLSPGAGYRFEELQDAIVQGYSRRVMSLLGQARKSGNAISGTSLVEGELRRWTRPRGLALVASDASGEIAEKIVRRLESAHVPFRIFMTKEGLGTALGKSPRSVVLVTDEGIAGAIEKSLDRYDRVLHKGGSDQ